MHNSRVFVSLALAGLCLPSLGRAQSVSVDSSQTFQSIDGFGTCLGSSEPTNQWWQDLYFNDLAASMVRIDITPTFTSTYSNLDYCSPWYGQPAPLRLDDGSGGPDGTRTRQYSSAADYSNSFGGCSAPIAVMGPNIDDNVKLFDFSAKSTFGLVAQLGKMKAAELGGFKLYASMWSPAPWVKISTDTYGGGSYPLPSAGVHFPFIWGGNFAGGQLDVSGTARSQFNDGTANTSALTQWARGLAAFLRGFQNKYGVSFYAISLQNELNFEEFYNSMTYPQSPAYITALKAARAEMDKYDDLKTIKIIGPEDLMGGDPYSLWEYGSGSTGTHKNLQYLQAISQDSTAESAIAGFAIHGYAPDGVSSAGASPAQWSAWADGWTTSPAGGIPANVGGFTSYDKPSWMTETSGEAAPWLSPSSGFPGSGAFSIAIKIQQALTAGQESAWLYWQITDGPTADSQALTDGTQLSAAPKYVAVKHFFKFIRPGAVRIAATVSGSTNLLASAYHLASTNSTTLVLINESSSAQTATVALPAVASTIKVFDAYTSSNGSLWQSSTLTVSSNSLSVPLPAYSVATLVSVSPVTGSDGGTDGGGMDGGGIVVDGGSDAGPDAGGDAGLDAGSDAGIDAGTDAGPDAGTRDAGTSDAGSHPVDGGEQAAAASSGCSTSPSAIDLSWLLALGAFALLRRRRAIE